MWELVRANKQKSFLLFIAMGVLLLLMGYLFGLNLIGENGGLYGLLLAAFIWIILSLISYFSGSSILLSVSGAKEVAKKVHPQLFNVVEEMTIAANLPKMPRIYIINQEAPNAFATGRTPQDSAIAVTAGLLSQMNRDELQGIIAHEMSHILNRDILFMTFSGIMLGSIVLLSEFYLRGMWFRGASSVGRYSSGSSSKSGGGGIITIIALLLAIFGPITAQFLNLAISRKREYMADATGARLTRYPEGLASALEKLSQNKLPLHGANKTTAGMYIVNPLKEKNAKVSELSQKELFVHKRKNEIRNSVTNTTNKTFTFKPMKGKKLSALSSTHPPIHERINILRSMGSGANYSDYQIAYSKVKQKGGNVIPMSALENRDKVGIRNASRLIEKQETITNQRRTLGDLMMKVNKYSFLSCSCGLKLKAPPEYVGKEVTCPRCGNRVKFAVES